MIIVEIGEVAVSLDQLPHDLRRMLRVQWKELIHSFEDYEIMVRSDRFQTVDLLSRRNAA